ncbi:MAG: hypothetical protein WKF75_13820, partial [Singulisphaera sp.]
DPRLPAKMDRFGGDDDKPWWPGATPSGPTSTLAGPGGLCGEGDMLEPRGEVLGHVIALPDADQMPGRPCLHARPPRRITRSIGDEGRDDEPAGPRPGYQQLPFRLLCIYALNPATPAVFVGHKGGHPAQPKSRNAWQNLPN